MIIEIPRFLSNQYPFHDIQMTVCGQADCPPDYSFGPYIRDFYLLHLVTDGCGMFSVGNKNYLLKKGDLFFIEPGILTFYQADGKEPWSYTWIGLQGIILPKLFSDIGLTRNVPVLRYSETLLETLEQIQHHADTNGFDSLNTMGYIYLFLNELTKCKPDKKITTPPQPLYIDAAVRYINQNIYSSISISQLSHTLGIDRSYFCSLFKKHLGSSPKQYIINLKMEKAKIFLETTDIDVKYIADSLGYGDLYTFSHSFKRKMGMSPSEWRKKKQTICKS